MDTVVQQTRDHTNDTRSSAGSSTKMLSDRYKIKQALGRGQYGKVLKCVDGKTESTVAVKVLRKECDYTKQGIQEVEILKQLQEANATSSCVDILDHFFHGNRLCIVFEELSQDLKTFQKERGFSPMHLSWVRIISRQILSALRKLKELKIVHTDLKPENIMMVDPLRQPLRVKIIDFGNAAVLNEDRRYKLLQTLHYRSPEIILGLPFNTEIDMWSFGCILTELVLGWCAFSGSTEYDQMRCIVDTLGLPCSTILNGALRSKQFFNRHRGVWTLKSRKQFQLETDKVSKDSRLCKVNSLNHILNIPLKFGAAVTIFPEDQPYEFIDLLKKMLVMDKQQRITPSNALEHPFMRKSW